MNITICVHFWKGCIQSFCNFEFDEKKKKKFPWFDRNKTLWGPLHRVTSLVERHTPMCFIPYLLCLAVAGDGILWSWLNHRPGEEHEERPEGGLDRLHFTRDPPSE